MVVQVENPNNSNMHGPNCCPGLQLEVPKPCPRPKIYSSIEARKQYNEIQQDVYQTINNAKPKDRGSFPTILKLILGGTAISMLIIFRKSILSSAISFFKDIFKR